MATTELTVKLPAEEIEFLRAYAKQHGLSVSDLMERYVQKLRSSTRGSIHPEVEQITGLVPDEIDAEGAYRQHVLGKHR
ncbi:MAG: hypothetical protein FJ388_18930 [Verrucomicrobia bacterium]|nr:hypothetical protein [Verrucomicrobiota bacterium]